MILVCFSSVRGVGLVFIWLVCLLTCIWGLVMVCLSFARGVGLIYLVGLPVGIWLCLLRADALSYF